MKTIIFIIILSFVGIYHLKDVTAQDRNNIKIPFRGSVKNTHQNILPDNPQANKNTVANGNWSSGSTWNGGTVPNSGDNVTIQNNVTLDILDSTISTGSLTINSGFTLTLNSETNLYIGGAAAISGTLILNAGSNYGTWVYPAGNFTINSGGTFNCSASNTHCDFYGTANQSLTNNGTITSPLNDLSIDNANNLTLASTGSISVNVVNINSGNLVNTATKNIMISSGGLLNRGDGTIAVTPGGTLYDLMYSNISPISSTGPELQNNSIIRDLTLNSADNVTMTANATVNGNFIIIGGNLNIGSNTLTLNGGIQAGGFFGTLTGGASSKLYLGGTGSLTLPDIQTQQLKKLTINRAANDKITLGGNLQMTDSLDIENGNINTDAYVLTLGSSGSSLGTLTYNAGTYTGIITGKFTRWFGTSSTQPVVKFPVGDVNAYSKPRMVTVQYTVQPTTAGTITAQYITGDPGRPNTASPIDSSVIPPYTVDTYGKIGYWQLTPTTLAGGTYSISIYPSGFIGRNDFSKLRVLERTTNTGALWTLQGAHVPGTSVPDTAANRSGLLTSGGFGQFALGGNSIDNPLDGPLPVELSSFSSSVNSNNVKLTWITASETNNQGFEIYRKSEQSNWIKIGFVPGSGTVNTPKTYTFNDNGLPAGKYSYELKQIDYNGNFEIFIMSGITEIGVPKKFEVSQNYPNPFNPVTKIDYQLPGEGKIKLVIYDMLGREVKNLVNDVKPAGFYSIEFDAGSLASGIYIYRLSFENSNNNFIITKKMSLIK